MTTTSKLNNNIVFSLAIFWGPRADKMWAEDKGQGPRVEEHKHLNKYTHTNREKYFAHFENFEMRITFDSQRDKKYSF